MKNFISTKKILISILIILSTMMLVISCAKEKKIKKNDLSGSIEIAGSSTVFPITTAIAEAFLVNYPELDIPIRSTGTGGGFKNFFVTGKTDINDASRTIKESEVLSAKEHGIEAIEFLIAGDAITLIVNPSLNVDNITTEELRLIWSPEFAAKTWSEVNPSWPNIDFELYGPSSASGTFDYFTKEINGEEGLSRIDYQKTEQDNTIIQAVSGSKAALGYLGLAYYIENADKVKALKVNGVAPSINNARNGTYTPLSRFLYIYVNSKSLKKREVQEFLKFYISQTSSSLISDIGYIPLNQSIVDENLQKLNAAIEKYGK